MKIKAESEEEKKAEKSKRLPSPPPRLLFMEFAGRKKEGEEKKDYETVVATCSND